MLYKNDPYLFIRSLKEGYVNQPIAFDEAIVRFFNGEELAIVHKTTGKRFSVNLNMKKLPDGFTLQTMDMWLWSEIVVCTHLISWRLILRRSQQLQKIKFENPNNSGMSLYVHILRKKAYQHLKLGRFFCYGN